MRVLFYLPGVTDRYFRAVILPLIRVMAREAEVHVAGPPHWGMTGLTDFQRSLCTDLTELRWHILDDDDHPSLRTAPSNPQRVIDYVRSIAPDYTLCRGADTSTPVHFPGRTRFIMEGVIPPFALKSNRSDTVILDGPRIFDQGFVPTLEPDERARLDRMFISRWSASRAHFSSLDVGRDAYLSEAGLPSDKIVVGLALNVDSATNYYIHQHSATPSNARLIERLAAELSDDVVLAVTKHPLNACETAYDKEVEPIEPVVDRLGGRVHIVNAPGPFGNATASLFRHCDGAAVCDSKSIGFAAFFGKPILRLSHYESAPWLGAYRDMPTFLADLQAGIARRPGEADAMTWFAFHYANNVFAAQNSALVAGELIKRMEQPVSPDLWLAGQARLAPFVPRRSIHQDIGTGSGLPGEEFIDRQIPRQSSSANPGHAMEEGPSTDVTSALDGDFRLRADVAR